MAYTKVLLGHLCMTRRQLYQFLLVTRQHLHQHYYIHHTQLHPLANSNDLILSLRSPRRGEMEALCLRPPPPPSRFTGGSTKRRRRKSIIGTKVVAKRRGDPTDVESKTKSSPSTRNIPRLIWPRNGDLGRGESTNVSAPPVVRRRRTRGNWITMILRIRSMWEGRRREEDAGGGLDVDPMLDAGDRSVMCCDIGEEEVVEMIGREDFCRLLRRVSLADTKLYAKLSHLGWLAYDIPIVKNKAENILKRHGLRYVISSLEKKSRLSSDAVAGNYRPVIKYRKEEEPKSQKPMNIKETYRIVASAASYLRFGTGKIDKEEEERTDNEARQNESFVMTTDSVTAVVAGEEDMKEAFSKELNSSHTSPCEWFICDDDTTRTRFFVIQGSDSLASWQTNLLFEPVPFEGFDSVKVHRGIYEAAKGIYSQVLPDVKSHLQTHGGTGRLRFTGHSLGGSLSLLVNLMLLSRSQAPASALLPVVTYGAPSVMCGGNHLLRKLGLPPSHVQAITMHRDIVPRAFSCTYPPRVSDILKAVNRNFRRHPCLEHQSLLYSPMGEMLILQPDARLSPQHHLLPPGAGLYSLTQQEHHSKNLLRSAVSTFLNSPHPLEILRDRSAYGANGAVNRNHDMSGYLQTMDRVHRQEQKRVKDRRGHQRRKTA